MTFDLELLRRSVSTVKFADTRSIFQLILNNFIMVSRRLSTSTDVSSSFRTNATALVLFLLQCFSYLSLNKLSSGPTVFLFILFLVKYFSLIRTQRL